MPKFLTNKWFLTFVVIFLIYAVLNAPRQSGGVVSDVWDFSKRAADSIGILFDTVLNS